MNINEDKQGPIWFDRAAEWFVKHDRGLTTEEKIEFEKQLQRYPELREEFARFTQTQIRAQGLPNALAKELLEEAQSEAPWFSRFRGLSALAATLIFGITLFWWTQSAANQREGFYQTEIHTSVYSETKALPDGSLIRLNSDTQLTIAYSPTTRQIQLEKGEAHFEVAKDPNRPFVVTIDEIKVVAVGTAFNIKREEDINVIVTEGIVRIAESELIDFNGQLSKTPDSLQPATLPSSENLLSQGQWAEITQREKKAPLAISLIEAEKHEIQNALKWHNSLLTIDSENLKEIAECFERKTGYQLHIADPSLESLQIGGRFPSDDVEGFLRILGEAYGIPWHKTEENVFVVGTQFE